MSTLPVSDAIDMAVAELRTRPRIAAWSIWDRHTEPVARSAEDVPWHADAITAAWLTATLGAQVEGASALTATIVGGDDGSSVRRRLHVEWNSAGQAAGLPAALFTKSTPTLPTRLSAGIAAPMEGRFLLTLRPSVAIEAPHCYFSARDAQRGRSIHVMEDLGVTQGATFFDALSPVDHDQAQQIVDTLASLHGTFLSSENVLPFGWLGRYEDFHAAADRSGIRAGHDAAMKQAADVIPTSVLNAKAKIWPAASAALSMHEEIARTVIHSDVHPGNWYRTAAGQMGLCDWARVCRGHWARDLAYALMTTLTVEDRRSWERELIERYLSGLEAHSGIAVMFNEAWLAYRKQSIAALLMWTPTLCPPAILPAMQPEQVSMVMIERITQAMHDLDVLSLF
ncbi:MAG: phosphotransferase family protein [Pseudomonadales bacterium]